MGQRSPSYLALQFAGNNEMLKQQKTLSRYFEKHTKSGQKLAESKESYEFELIERKEQKAEKLAKIEAQKKKNLK